MLWASDTGRFCICLSKFHWSWKAEGQLIVQVSTIECILLIINATDHMFRRGLQLNIHINSHIDPLIFFSASHYGGSYPKYRRLPSPAFRSIQFVFGKQMEILPFLDIPAWYDQSDMDKWMAWYNPDDSSRHNKCKIQQICIWSKNIQWINCMITLIFIHNHWHIICSNYYPNITQILPRCQSLIVFIHHQNK